MNHTAAHSAAIGLATRNLQGEIIEVFYPEPQLHPEPGCMEMLIAGCQLEMPDNGWAEISSGCSTALVERLQASGYGNWAEVLAACAESSQTTVLCVSFTDAAPDSIPEAYLKLHLLSHRLVKPHEVNLEGIFGVLRNLAWTNEGAIDLDDLPARQLAARKAGTVLDIMSVDKFPRMTNYVVPTGVRLADTARIRLGAYIGEGTTVMHEGFVNFNAGTLGTAMVEGRISAGVVLDENSDLGGGASVMGTLSGGGTTINSVGKNCLIGANAGIGFPLPDGCMVEAGLYVTGGTKVRLLDASGEFLRISKARDLSEIPNLLYRRNSLSGAVEAIPTRNSISLNEELHSHN